MDRLQSISNGQQSPKENLPELAVSNGAESESASLLHRQNDIANITACVSNPAETHNQPSAFDVLINDLNDVLLEQQNGKIITDNRVVEDRSLSADNMSKFYTKFSQQCSEIERLENMVQKLQNQLKSACHEKEANASQIKDLNRHHANKVTELEKRLMDIDSQCRVNRERFNNQEELIRRNYADKEANLTAQIEQLKKSNDVARKERDNAVIKYAQREKESLTLELSEKKMHQQLQQVSVEKDALNARLRGAKNEKEQLLQVLAQKENDASDWKRKHDDLRNLLNEREIKAKMAEKRIEIIDKAHMETRSELEKATKKLQESKEENAALKSHYEQMIVQFQASKQCDSAADHVTQNSSHEPEREKSDEVALYKQENENLKSQVNALHSELSDCNAKIDTLNKTMQTKEHENALLQESILDFRTMSDEHTELKRLYEELKRRSKDLEQENLDLERESASFRLNAENMLELTHKLTDKNSCLHSDNMSLTSRLETIEQEKSELESMCQEVKSQLAHLTKELDTSRSLYRSEIGDLREKLSATSQAAESSNILLEDERNQNRILNKKHAAAVKDLRSEISLLKRRLDAYEAGTASQCSTGSPADERRAEEPSNGSRSPSMTSLDVPNSLHTQTRQRTSHGAESPHIDSPSIGFQPPNYELQQTMIEKIVKLQRKLARRSEKLEFLEEHVRQMTLDSQKKCRIIQMYVMRDETTGFSSASVDLNKTQIAQKGNTIMGRVFGGNSVTQLSQCNINDLGQLSPDLAVQIMSKLQALFEDTVFKNITLKENIQTLGEEVAALSRENRTLKLQLSQT